MVPALTAAASSSLPSATRASMTVWTLTLLAFATSATVLPELRAVVRSASLMPIALATTDVSVTTSWWPPKPPLWLSLSPSASVLGFDVALAVVVLGLVTALGAGDAAAADSGPIIAAPAIPPMSSDPAIAAFGWRRTTLAPALARAGEVTGSVGVAAVASSQLGRGR